RPQGAFYFFPNFSNFIPEELEGEDRKTYILNKLMDAGVAVVNGGSFGSHFNDNIRLSFSCTSIEDIDRGLARMKAALGKPRTA
ncbi:MAG: pyridoxal phosphate-dependent aminotransferase, partial [Bacteroidota bacterium]